MKKILFLLILLITLQIKGQQFSNKIITDTLDLYTHWGILRIIDTVGSDTTYITDELLKTVSTYMDVIASKDSVNIEITDDALFDSTVTADGGYIANAIAQAYKAEYNISSQLGTYVHGIKVEHTRTADIQPSTGGWFGGQFVLNAGTTAWDDIDKSAYAIQAVIKGDQWDGVQDVNAGRFELQSSGSVKDIVYILANTGTSVSSSMLYMPTHVSLPNMIQFNAQSNSTITNGIDFVSGAGSQFKYGIDLSGATIDSADIKFSDGTTMPGYRSESRVDTLTTLYMYSHGYFGTQVQANGSWQMNNLLTYGILNFHYAATYALIPMQILCDSAYIDSIAWGYGWTGTPPDTDTVYFVYSDSVDWSQNYPKYIFTQVDTVGASEINKDSYGELLIMNIGKGYRIKTLESPMRMGFEYEIESGSGQFNWTTMIFYYTAFWKR